VNAAGRSIYRRHPSKTLRVNRRVFIHVYCDPDFRQFRRILEKKVTDAIRHCKARLSKLMDCVQVTWWLDMAVVTDSDSMWSCNQNSVPQVRQKKVGVFLLV
jgi:hypothetical protein